MDNLKNFLLKKIKIGSILKDSFDVVVCLKIEKYVIFQGIKFDSTYKVFNLTRNKAEKWFLDDLTAIDWNDVKIL